MEAPKEIGPVSRPAPLSPVRRSERPAQAQPGAERDEVSLSEEGQAMLRVRQQALSASDVREDLVARVRSEVEQGTYRPPASEIARRLLPALRHQD